MRLAFRLSYFRVWLRNVDVQQGSRARVLGRREWEDEPGKRHSERHITALWRAEITKRLQQDILQTKKRVAGERTIPEFTVEDTWEGVVIQDPGRTSAVGSWAGVLVGRRAGSPESHTRATA